MNMKTLKEKLHDKLTKQNIKIFFKKQGLYVLIFLCLVAAGITALIAWPRDEEKMEIGDPNITTDNESGSIADNPVSVSSDMTLEEQQALDDEVNNPDINEGDEDDDAQDNDQPVINNGSGSIKLTKPVSGQIIQDFSGDSLVFFASLNIWATHNGIDIKADENADVAAALSGTVEDVFTNEADGGVVIISHSDNSKTVYAGLKEMTVKIGDKVNAGQTIGKIGKLPKELDLGFHLHFEYIVKGSFKDPAKYF